MILLDTIQEMGKRDAKKRRGCDFTDCLGLRLGKSLRKTEIRTGQGGAINFSDHNLVH